MRRRSTRDGAATQRRFAAAAVVVDDVPLNTSAAQEGNLRRVGQVRVVREARRGRCHRVLTRREVLRRAAAVRRDCNNSRHRLRQRL